MTELGGRWLKVQALVAAQRLKACLTWAKYWSKLSLMMTAEPEFPTPPTAQLERCTTTMMAHSRKHPPLISL